MKRYSIHNIYVSFENKIIYTPFSDGGFSFLSALFYEPLVERVLSINDQLVFIFTFW